MTNLLSSPDLVLARTITGLSTVSTAASSLDCARGMWDEIVAVGAPA